MNTVEESVKKVKEVLVSADVITYPFASVAGKKFCLVYVDGLVEKPQLGELVVKPLAAAKKDATADDVRPVLASPEVKESDDFKTCIDEISYGAAVLFIDGESTFFIIGLTKPPGRAVAEPPTQIAVKGPREGFTEDLKVNCALVRKRLKSEKLRMDTVRTGRRSDTAVTVCYIDGVCDPDIPKKLKEQIEGTEPDIVADSSYVDRFVSSRPRSLFKRCGTCEKPDIFCAKLSEGRVGMIVDGSPIAITVPYLLVEDFQSNEDYFVPAYRATFTRLLRLFALLVAIYLPAFYVAAQLFKLQLLPVKLLLTIAGSIRDIPLSPSLEMLLVLLVLEVLNEASIRMPKYVGMALSVVAAPVLGETAVSAGFVSTPAIIIVAFSGIGLYAVPNLIEETSVLRLAMLLAAGSVGTYGIVLLTALTLVYLVSTENFGVPLGAPFAPFIRRDLRDTFVKYNLLSLKERPASLSSPNKRRQK